MNEREIKQDGLTLCRACAHSGYYQMAQQSLPAPYIFSVQSLSA
jgi:hypothetical protein